MSSSLVIILVLVISCIGVHSERTFTSEGTLDAEQKESEDYESDEPRQILVTHGADVVNSTSTQDGDHYRDITVTVTAFGETYELYLSLNTRLFASHYIEKTITYEGEEYRNVNHAHGHCFYLGTVRNKPQSTAAITTCNGITGYFAIENVSYHIDPQDGKIHGMHVVYRSLPNATPVYRCGSDHIAFESLVKSATPKIKVKRSINWPQFEDKKIRVVEMYIVNDYSQYQARGKDSAAVFQRAKEIVNIASSAYQALGIYLVLVGMEVWSESNKFPIDPGNISLVLNNWYVYRQDNVNPYHYNDNAVLITNTRFGKMVGGRESKVGGRAALGSICSNRYSGSVVSDDHWSAHAIGTIMAHELGHNFGLEHDDASCSCDDDSGLCIMYTSTNMENPGKLWSSCSRDKFSNTFQHGGDICLYNIPDSLLQPNVSTCGNGIVETGEECDCGKLPNEECSSHCCNAMTCRLFGSASCASGGCCDVARCQIREVGAQCRNKSDGCDLAEFCDGVQSLCPADTYKPDGTLCTVNQESAYCYQGQCRSHSSQCELLWGSGTRSSNDLCYTVLNTRGFHSGNCGFNWLPNVTYIPCHESDTICGLLHCEDNKRPLAYYQSVNMYLQSSGTVGGYSYRSVIFDYGIRVQDPGLVPNGAKCGDAKICVSQKCVNISSLTHAPCSSCRPDEVCDNLGQCRKTPADQVLNVAAITTTT